MDLEKILPENGPPITEVTKYIKKYKNDLIVIKYGGNVLIDRNVFNNFITDLSILNKLGLATVVIHGGGPRIKRELEKSNIQSKFIRGLRVTDRNIISIVESVLIDFNDDIVSSLKEKGTEAISIHTKKNNVIKTIPEAEELGFVGIPNEINNEQILKVINENKIPIISPLGLGKENQTYNINGDTAAMAVAKSLKSRRLLLMTNVDGVLDSNLQTLINDKEVGTLLLTLIEIIGKEKVENIDEKNLYFILTSLNQINADLIRNKLLLKVLPLKV